MSRPQVNFAFLNVGHFLDHLFMLIFATVAALALTREWGLSYAELIPYATPGFVAFGLCAIPAGWLADKWSRTGMITTFFIGVGAASLVAGFAETPLQIGAALLLIGIFGAIYHPVGIAMVVRGRKNTGMALALNGVFGNLGVAAAALITGFLIDLWGWRAAFVLPGVASMALGIGYWIFNQSGGGELPELEAGPNKAGAAYAVDRKMMIHIFSIIFFTTAVGGLIFQSTTFALPKIFDERLNDIATTATEVGVWAFIVFALAALAQLVVGFLIDRYSVRLIFTVIAAAQVACFAAMIPSDGYAALAIAVLFMLLVFGQIPINDVLVGRVAKSEWRSRAYAARSFITFTVMALTLPMVAWLHATWGFEALFIVLCVAAALITVAVFQLPHAHAVTGTASAPAE